MGLLRDAIGSALGAGQLNNGISGGPRLPFSSGRSRHSRRSSLSSRNQSSSYNQDYSDYNSRRGIRRRSYDGIDFGSSDRYPDRQNWSSAGRYPPDGMQRTRDGYESQSVQSPPSYTTCVDDDRGYQSQPYERQTYAVAYHPNDGGYSRGSGFRPLALPQVSYGGGQPFLRGYSQELGRYNITAEDFIQVLDSINIAIIPNPENQIFQKGANIAGFFLPGAASIGLTVGQIGVGIGAAAGHASQLSSTLLTANMKLFIPNGLELCIGGSTDVDAEVGISQSGSRSYSLDISPEERISYYGDLVAPLSRVLPPLQQSGRNDPLAMLGRGMSSRDRQKKLKRAEKGLRRGRSKGVDQLEGSLKWLIVRRASADALAYWETHRR